jgi:hypothetical protein
MLGIRNKFRHTSAMRTMYSPPIIPIIPPLPPFPLGQAGGIGGHVGGLATGGLGSGSMGLSVSPGVATDGTMEGKSDGKSVGTYEGGSETGGEVSFGGTVTGDSVGASVPPAMGQNCSPGIPRSVCCRPIRDMRDPIAKFTQQVYLTRDCTYKNAPPNLLTDPEKRENAAIVVVRNDPLIHQSFLVGIETSDCNLETTGNVLGSDGFGASFDDRSVCDGITIKVALSFLKGRVVQHCQVGAPKFQHLYSRYNNRNFVCNVVASSSLNDTSRVDDTRSFDVVARAVEGEIQLKCHNRGLTSADISTNQLLR